MTIGDLIKNYRKKNNLSMRLFAEKCGVSHSYIAMLENEKNSKTGEPIVPSIYMLNKLAKGMLIPLNELISVCDDMPISLASIGDKNNLPEQQILPEGELLLLELFRKLPKEAQESYTEKLREALKTLGLI